MEKIMKFKCNVGRCRGNVEVDVSQPKPKEPTRCGYGHAVDIPSATFARPKASKKQERQTNNVRGKTAKDALG